MFKKAGMNSFGSGKVYHPFIPKAWDGHKSWSDKALPFDNPCWFYGISCLPCTHINGTHVEPICSDHGFGPGSVKTCWCEIEAAEDVLTVNRAITLLGDADHDYKEHGKQFYLAVGLHKPHLPWQASKKHFDMYRAAAKAGNITAAKHRTAPEGTALSLPPLCLPSTDKAVGMPGVAFSSCDSPSPWSPLNDTDAVDARIAYYAATSGMDEQVGRVVDALRERDLLNSTAIGTYVHASLSLRLP